jgi:hypothetical protein
LRAGDGAAPGSRSLGESIAPWIVVTWSIDQVEVTTVGRVHAYEPLDVQVVKGYPSKTSPGSRMPRSFASRAIHRG